MSSKMIPAGNIIGYVVAKDNDTEKNKLLTFNITNGNAENFFAVNKNTGAILINGNLNGQRRQTVFTRHQGP